MLAVNGCVVTIFLTYPQYDSGGSPLDVRLVALITWFSRAWLELLPGVLSLLVNIFLLLELGARVASPLSALLSASARCTLFKPK